MNWMTASILAGVVAASAPLLMVESLPATRSTAHLATARRRLFIATCVAIAVHLGWLYLDRSSVSRGDRSLAVSTYAVIAFAVLFIALAYPILRALPRPAEASVQRISVFRAPQDLPVLLVTSAGAAAVFLSPNGLGYRLKGALILGAGLTLYFLGRPRAVRTFAASAVVAAIAFYVNWSNPWHRTIGVASQVAIGVVGFVWCAHLLVRPNSSGDAA
jgi:hypothetical protein